VSGTIHLARALNIDNPHITIAGQTAPSPGIALSDHRLVISTHDVLVQHLRVRPGGASSPGEAMNMDAVQLDGEGTHSVVIDHCSFSWSIDESMNTWTEVGTIHDITFRYNIFSEPLHDSLHPEGPHGMGPLIGKNTERTTFHRNLLAHVYTRSPRLAGLNTVSANNLMYNCLGWTKTYCQYASCETSVVGNVFKRGSNSDGRHPIDYQRHDPYSTSGFVLDNLVFDESQPDDPWDLVSVAGDGPFEQLASPVVWPDHLSLLPSSAVHDHVLAHVGARPLDRSSVDARIIDEVRTATGGFVDCVWPAECSNNAGGWPDLAENTRTLTLPADPSADADEDGYTNLEEWLHDLSAELEGLPACEDSPACVGCDAGTADAGDAGARDDAAPPIDGARPPTDGTTGSADSSDGCTCTSAGHRSTPWRSLPWLALLAAAGFRSRRANSADPIPRPRVSPRPTGSCASRRRADAQSSCRQASRT
jgi:hypothetical protein